MSIELLMTAASACANYMADMLDLEDMTPQEYAMLCDEAANAIHLTIPRVNRKLRPIRPDPTQGTKENPIVIE